MPGLNGIEFISRVKRLNPYIRTLLMTAFEIKDSLFSQYVKQEIINSFLQKPIEIKDLLEEVNKQIHIHKIKR